MRRGRRLPFAGIFAFAALASLFGPGSLFGEELPSEFDSVERIVAIGDVHGAYDRLVALLKRTELVDSRLGWIGGATHLVQTGDVLDRGPDSRMVLDLLMRLEGEALAAGGRVHALIGNHEFWNAVGLLGYVSAQEFGAFDGARDRELRKKSGLEDAPAGALALREAYGADGDYGRWIRGRNAAVRIGDFVFVHGGITREAAALGLRELNRRVRADLDEESTPWSERFAMSEDGPLFTRRFSAEEMTEAEAEARGAELEEVLRALGARTMVMAHTITFGLIEPRFAGRAVLIDTGMLDVYLGGREAALLVDGGRLYAVHPGGRVEVPKSLEGEAGRGYLEAVVAAAPADDAVKYRLAVARLEEGSSQEARKLFERSGATDPTLRVPFFWRKEAARSYQELGEKERARELGTLYLKELHATAEAMGGDGAPLLDRFARESLRAGVMVEEAFEAARRAAEARPDELPFKTTLAWAYVETGDAARAVRVLTLALRRGGDGFDARLVLGRAHLALGDRETALRELRAARSFEPENSEVRKLLAELDPGPK